MGVGVGVGVGAVVAAAVTAGGAGDGEPATWAAAAADGPVRTELRSTEGLTTLSAALLSKQELATNSSAERKEKVVEKINK